LNVAVEQQALARVHRFGQTRPVRIVRFICHDTVEVSSLSPTQLTAILTAIMPIGDVLQVGYAPTAIGTVAAPAVPLMTCRAEEAEAEQALLTEAALNAGSEDVSSRKPRRPIEPLCTMRLGTCLEVDARFKLAYACAGGGPRDREQAGAAGRSRSQHRQ